MGKFARSWALMKASANILRQDKELMLFPLLAGFASLLVIATFAWPVWALFAHHQADFEGQRQHVSPLFMLVSFLFYFVQYGVVIFFNVALASAALIRLGGGNPTLGDGIRTAMGKLPNIIGYALIAATVGMILRALQERLGFVGRIVAGFLGFGWTVATFLVVPVLAAQDVGPVDAVKRSTSLLKQTWGENLIGNAGIGVVFGLLSFVLIVVMGALVVGALTTESLPLIVAAIAVAVVSLIVLALVQASLQGIYSAALYQYAEEGKVGGGFDQALLEQAFRTKS